ncbi:hypothetical protein HK104_005958 [Borealophlyctis nickersoniae]|nr:hypothetical protein HK104_005958 [Borealophlyctis nickersoniae]
MASPLPSPTSADFESSDEGGLQLFPPMDRKLSSSARSKDILEQKNELGPKLVIFMVGLPARGKSYICKKLVRYLSWCGFNTKVFNVGNRRRVMGSAHEGAERAPPEKMRKDPLPGTVHVAPSPKRALGLGLGVAHLFLHRSSCPVPEPCPSPIHATPAGSTQHDAKFFDPQNEEAKALRERLALDTLDEAIMWLNHGGGKVAIHDATNSTIARRKALLDRVSRERNIKALFIDTELLEQNIQMKLKGPDYQNMDPQQALEDFKARTRNYEKSYQTLSEEEERRDVSYIKLINVGKKIIAHEAHGYLPSQCVFYLMQMHLANRTIWLTRHGESVYNLEGRIGGDPPLTASGREYARALARFLKQMHPPFAEEDADGEPDMPPSPQVSDDNFGTARKAPLSVWTSALRRTIESADYFDEQYYEVKKIKALNEIYAGQCENMTYDEIQQRYPEEFRDRAKNKLLYRYSGSGGESYVDVIERLRPIIIELERMRTSVLIVTHQVVMRTLLAYFVGVPLDEMPTLQVPLHCLYCVRPKPYGADLIKYQYNPETNWFDNIGTTLK